MENEEFVKQENGVTYYEKFPKWIRVKYYETIDGKCSLCKKKMLYNEMYIHRIKRATHGGLYTFCKLDHPKQNCMFVHIKCHKLLHQNEDGHGSHSY